MACLERIESIIRAPRRANKFFTRRLVYLLIIFIIFLLSFCSNRWISSTENYNHRGTNYTSRNQGLWKYCQLSAEERCCAYINDIIDSHGHSVPAFLDATRSFMVFALFTQLCCLQYLFLRVFISADPTLQDCEKIIIYALCACTGIFIFLSICIYGGRYQISDWTSQYSLNWSFGLGIVPLLMISGIPFLVCFDE